VRYVPSFGGWEEICTVSTFFQPIFFFKILQNRLISFIKEKTKWPNYNMVGKDTENVHFTLLRRRPEKKKNGYPPNLRLFTSASLARNSYATPLSAKILPKL
jgi:hypothetical protein